MNEFSFLEKEDKEFVAFKDRFINNFYSDVDRGHGYFHIQTTYENALYGYRLTPEVKQYPFKFVVLCVIAHDIGLSKKVVSTFLPKYKNSSADELRELHHLNGAQVFEKMFSIEKYYNNKYNIQDLFLTEEDFLLFKKYIESDVLCEKGSKAISEHRASVSQSTDLSRFLRTCDGLNTAEFTMKRAILYNIDHCISKNKKEIIIQVKNHLMEKYCAEQHYSKDLPYEWANRRFQIEVDKLKKMLMEIDPDVPSTYLKYFHNLN